MQQFIDKKDILNLAKISKISIKDENLENITNNMRNIIKLTEQILEANISNESFDYIKNKTKGILREDKVSDSFSSSKILKGAIDKDSNFFVIKNSKK